MRIQKHALNNDYYDQDYLIALRLKKVGKNVLAHRTTVFANPETVSIGDNVTIEPYVVFLEGHIEIGSDVRVQSHSYFAGNVKITKDVPHGLAVVGDIYEPEEEKPVEKPLAKPKVWGEEDGPAANRTETAKK